jgi:hypothetical protein
MTIYAVGMPGQMPRQWVEADNEIDAQAQCRVNEIKSDAVTMGEDGRPVAVALPTT